MDFLTILTNFIFSFLATVGFSVTFNAPLKSLIPCGCIGSIGWITYIILSNVTGSTIFSNLIASSLIALFGEILARRMKYPAINFVIPGILPLVPGLGLYNTMLALVQKDYGLCASKGTDALLASGAIALGILIVISFTRTYYIILKKLKDKKLQIED